MNAQPIRVRFGTAKNGWLPVLISTFDSKIEYAASYVPKDIVLSLTEVLLEIAESHTAISRSVVLFHEPAESEIHFIWSGPISDSLSLQVLEFPDHLRTKGPGQAQLSFQNKRGAILLSFWRALRDLESRVEQESFETQWRHTFPSKELSLLTSAIDAIQHGSGAA